MKKKLMYSCLIISMIILIFENIVNARYILTKKAVINFSSAPFYFEAEANESSTKMTSRQANLGVTIKNYVESALNKFDTNYTLKLENNNKFNLALTDSNDGTILGNSIRNNEVALKFTPITGVELKNEEEVIVLVESTTPYRKVIEIPITILQPVLANDGRSDYRKVQYSDDTEGKPIEEYNRLYGGNNGEIEVAADGSIVLDEDNPVMVFNKSDKNYTKEYSIYVTIKGDIDQVPKTATGEDDAWGPATIFAMSGQQFAEGVSVVNRLCWFGFRNGCFQIYSYLGTANPSNVNDEFYDPVTYPGFLSKKMPREYDDKIINLQITANTNNSTKIYINGELWTSFASGNGNGDFFEATIGDLRALRGLKFIGNFYDIAVYDRVLNEAEIQENWEYAQNKWNIE